MSKYNNIHISVNLRGPGGNAHAILGAVERSLQRAGASVEEIQGFNEDAKSSDYEHLLKVCEEWVDFDGYYPEEQEDPEGEYYVNI